MTTRAFTPDSAKRKWLSLVFIIVSLFVITLDNTVLNVALPSISSKLGASAAELQWIVDAYVLALAALLLTMGYLGDRLGRKTFLEVGLIVFSLFSLGAALSGSAVVLICLRALMGVGAAIIMPSGLSILTSTFHDPLQRGQAIAIWSAAFALGLGVGPLLGGWLLEHFNWQSIFFLNLPITLVGFAGIRRWAENSKAENPRRLDIPGLILSAAGLFLLVFAIIKAGQEGWTASSVVADFAAAVFLLSAFAAWEAQSRHALLPLWLFQNRSFSAANLALTLVYFVLFGVFFFLSQFLQSVQAYSPFQAGVRILPIAIVTFLFAAFSARVARSLGTRYTSAVGILLCGLGLYYFSRIAGVEVSYVRLAAGMAITSAGIGLCVSPLTNSIMGSVPFERAGVGAAMNDTTRQVGGALGVAVLGALLNGHYLNEVSSLKSAIPDQVLVAVQSGVQGAHIAAGALPDPVAAQKVLDYSRAAFTSGMAEALLVAAGVMVATALVTLFLLPNRIQRSE